MNNLISIIIPIYNAEKSLDRCIQSVINQSFKNIQLILVNDGSTDASEEKCFYWLRKDRRIKYYYQKNCGVSSARNFGLKHIDGEFVVFVDSDDFLENSFCEKLHSVITKTNAEIVFCERIDHSPTGTTKISGNKSKRITIINSSEFEYYGNKERRSVWGAIYNTKILKKLFFSEELYVGEDALFLIQAIQKTKTIAYYDEPLYNYLIQSESAYFGGFTEKKNTEIQAWIQICDSIKSNGATKLSANAMCANVSKTMLSRYAGSHDFDKKHINYLINIYRNKFFYLLKHDFFYKRSIIKVIWHVLIWMFPHIFVKHCSLINKQINNI